MTPGYATKGTYLSPVLDATQISRFGKMQLHGSLPPGSGLTVSTRSGNVREPVEKGWSNWSDENPAEEILPIGSPSARFLQYRLTFTSKEGIDTTSADEEQHTTDFEDRLRQRIESIVTSVVGPGHVRAQVSADLNYNRVSETSEKYDPDSKVVRSTQTVEQNANDSQKNSSGAVSVSNALPGAQPQNGTDDKGNQSTSAHTEETTNYEISKTVTTSNMNGGDVKRLSVAVVVDGEPKWWRHTEQARGTQSASD